MSGGGLAPTEQLGASRFQLPLSRLGNRLVIGPVEDSPTAHIEKAGELGIRFQAEQRLNGGFGHVHGRAV